MNSTAIVQPKLDVVTRTRDERRHLCPKGVNVEHIEDALHQIVHTYFHDQLTIMESKKDEKETKWIIKTRDTEYIYGFSILFDGHKIFAGHPLNTISIWMQDLMQEALAKHYGVKLVMTESERLVDATPDAIDTFRNWLYLRAKGQPAEKIARFYEYQADRLPDGLKQYESYSITH